MNYEEQAYEVLDDLYGTVNGHRVAKIDPATIAIIIAILRQVYPLLQSWLTKLFLRWQVKRIVKRETSGTDLQGRSDRIKEIVLKKVRG